MRRCLALAAQRGGEGARDALHATLVAVWADLDLAVEGED